jgi:AcrR family transcriptional regulator
MPKHVDHDERRAELAEAVWRLIVRHGVEAASIRRVAAEAGWSTGSLRHYFATQSELLTFSMELVAARVTERLQTLTPPADPHLAVQGLLEQILPLDDDRRAEMHVWLAFSTRAAVDPALRPLRDASHAGLAEMCRQIAEALGAPDPDLAGADLHALADGLALQGVLTPELMPPDRIRVLIAHRIAILS